MSYNHLAEVDKIVNDRNLAGKLTVYEIAVLYRLAGRAHRDTGECWLSQRTLAKQLNIARSTVCKAICGLGRKEYLTSRLEPGPYGVLRTYYTVLPTTFDDDVTADTILRPTTDHVDGEDTWDGQ